MLSLSTSISKWLNEQISFFLSDSIYILSSLVSITIKPHVIPFIVSITSIYSINILSHHTEAYDLTFN